MYYPEPSPGEGGKGDGGAEGDGMPKGVAGPGQKAMEGQREKAGRGIRQQWNAGGRRRGER